MTAFPPQVDAQDVPHLGILFKRIREARGLSQTEIARALGVTSSTISKLEGSGRSRRSQIVERYVQLLRSLQGENDLIPFPLSEEAAELLIQLGREANGNHCQVLAARISAYDFGLIASPNCPPELKTLLRRLRLIRWPAFICDGLWFVHAVNGAMLNFFDIDAESTVLYRWESWHIIGAELVRSHIRPADAWLPGQYYTACNLGVFPNVGTLSIYPTDARFVAPAASTLVSEWTPF